MQALRLLPATPVYPGSLLTPYQPVPDTNGEEWDRLETVTALDALVNNVLDGEYGGVVANTTDVHRGDALEFRSHSLSVFEVSLSYMN
jgi:intracellular protein transport protein USO1